MLLVPTIRCMSNPAPTPAATVNKPLTLDGAGAGIELAHPLHLRNHHQQQLGRFCRPCQRRHRWLHHRRTNQRHRPAPGFGYAIYLQSGSDGTQIINDIIQDNHAGIALSNVGTTQAKIEQNLFQDNTAGGLATDIYADQYTSGGDINNILIHSNKFTNSSNVEDSWAIGFSDTDTAHPVTDVQISNNDISNHGRGIYLFDANNDSITANNISGATHYAVGVFGSVDTNLDIGQNTLDGNNDGVTVGSEEGPTVDVTGLSIHNNFIENNTNVGVSLDNTVTTTAGGIAANTNAIDGNAAGLINDTGHTVDATNNWWGSANGPTTPENEFEGMPKGDSITGSGTTLFSPWLADGIDSNDSIAGFQHDPSSAMVPERRRFRSMPHRIPAKATVTASRTTIRRRSPAHPTPEPRFSATPTVICW